MTILRASAWPFQRSVFDSLIRKNRNHKLQRPSHMVENLQVWRREPLPQNFDLQIGRLEPSHDVGNLADALGAPSHIVGNLPASCGRGLRRVAL